jgi:hypothetical protein
MESPTLECTGELEEDVALDMDGWERDQNSESARVRILRIAREKMLNNSAVL